METDISPIFGNNNDVDKADIAALVPDHPTQDESSPLQDVIDDHPTQEQLGPEYSQHFQPAYPHQQPTYMYPPPQPHAPLPPKWDPFSSVGATAWVVMALAFILGFVIGKLR